MKIEFKKSFAKDLKKRKDEKLRSQIKEIIEQVETAPNIHELKNLKKLKLGEKYFRIKLSDFRIGLIIEGDTVTFVRLLHRSEVYRYFP